MEKIIQASLNMDTQTIKDMQHKKVKLDQHIIFKTNNSDADYSLLQDHSEPDDHHIQHDDIESSVHSQSIDIEEYKKYIAQHPSFDNLSQSSNNQKQHGDGDGISDHDQDDDDDDQDDDDQDDDDDDYEQPQQDKQSDQDSDKQKG